MDLQETKAMLTSSDASELGKTRLLVTADDKLRQALFRELLADLERSPGRELVPWEVGLLLLCGERVKVKRVKSNGEELTLEELKNLLDRLTDGLSYEELMSQEEIDIKQYWVPREVDYQARGESDG